MSLREGALYALAFAVCFSIVWSWIRNNSFIRTKRLNSLQMRLTSISREEFCQRFDNAMIESGHCFAGELDNERRRFNMRYIPPGVMLPTMRLDWITMHGIIQEDRIYYTFTGYHPFNKKGNQQRLEEKLEMLIDGSC